MIGDMLPENSLTESEQVPDKVFQETVNDLALRGCQAGDPQNNLLRILILMKQADDDMRSLFIEKLIYLIFAETDEFIEALDKHLRKLNEGMLGKRPASKRARVKKSRSWRAPATSNHQAGRARRGPPFCNLPFIVVMNNRRGLRSGNGARTSPLFFVSGLHDGFPCAAACNINRGLTSDGERAEGIASQLGAAMFSSLH